MSRGERRIGQRVRVRDLELIWAPRRADGRASRRERCRVVDVSVTGALLVSREADVEVGSPVNLEVAGEISAAEVRRIGLRGTSVAAYGVEFVELGPRLQAMVFEPIGRHRSSPPDHER